MSDLDSHASSVAVHGDGHDVDGYDGDENGSPITNGMRNEMVVDEGRCDKMGDGGDGWDDDNECAKKQIKKEGDEGEGGEGDGANKEKDQLMDREYEEEDKDDEKNEEEEEEEEDCKVGLDGGYGWVVVLAAFLSWVLGAVYFSSGGLFFLQFQERFYIGAMLAAWPYSTMWVISYFSGPLVAVVCNRYSVRTALMIGTSLIFIGLILISTVDNFYFLFFSFSLLQGVGLSFLLSPGAYIISSYFDKRRGFAVSLSISGGAAGSFVMVLLVNHLFETFGYQGCFLIIAGIMAHGYIVAMLSRPFNIHQKYLMTQQRIKSQATRSSGNAVHTDNNCSSLSKTAPDTMAEVNSNISQHARQYTNDAGQRSTDCTTCKLTHTDSGNDQEMFVHKGQGLVTINVISADKTTKSNRKKSIRKACYSELKSCLDILFPIDFERKANTARRKMFHFGFLKDVTFLLFQLGIMILTVVLISLSFIPPLCVDKGLTKAEAALVVSIVGGVDFFARVGIGFVLDMPKPKQHRGLIFGGLLFIMALVGFCLPSLSSFASFVVMCSVLNACVGTHICQRAVVLLEMFGKEVLPSCEGITKVSQAFGILAGPLLFGALRDATGSYDTAFYVSSCLAIVGGVFFILCNALHQRRVKTKELQESGPRQQLTSSL